MLQHLCTWLQANASSLITLYEKTAGPDNATFYEPSNAQTFIDACSASAQPGSDERVQKGYSDSDKMESMKYFKRARKLGLDNHVPVVPIAGTINRISRGIILAWELRDKDQDWDNFPSSLANAQKPSLRRLHAIFAH
jgi:hypothetical protein